MGSPSRLGRPKKKVERTRKMGINSLAFIEQERFMHTAQQTAVLLAVVLNRSGQNRARVSSKTIKLLGQRHNLRSAFFTLVAEALLEYGWALIEIPGGYSASKLSTLSAAKAVTAKNLLTDAERKAVKDDKSDWRKLEREAQIDIIGDIEDD